MMVTTQRNTDYLVQRGARVWRKTKAERRWESDGGAPDSKRSPWFSDTSGSRSWMCGNRFATLEQSVETGCARSRQNIRKVQKIVKLLQVDQSLKPAQPVPSTVPCGSLRKAVRSMYPRELSLVHELSIKTSAKAEAKPCTFCENLQEEKLDEWEKARYQPQDVDVEHLERFASALSANVPVGWDSSRTAYVPNGHASLGKSRCMGGNWNETPFSDEVEVQLVHSSGKPRVVTLYSSRNVAVLTPLHNSLYNCLRRRRWLLVGTPTDEELRQVSEGTLGPEWLSFDYESATDNIKTAYVRRAVDILIERAVQLSEEEIRALRVFSELTLSRGPTNSGQPMGSPMSFPLLCLINKATVDLALSSMLMNGEIRVKEWTRHRCRINGDDLLTKSTSGGDFVSSLAREGGQVGLRVNQEKTMRSVRDAEINSTAFRDGRLVKKTNVASLWMSSEVEDVLGFADDSTCTARGFRAVAEGNGSRLARAETKVQRELPFTRKEQVCKSRRLKAAIRSHPVGAIEKATNLFPVVPRPAGYDLTHEEEVKVIEREVVRIRNVGSWKGLRPQAARIAKLRKERKFVSDTARSGRDNILRKLRLKTPREVDRTLSVLASEWHYKRKEQLRLEEPFDREDVFPPSDFSKIQTLLDHIKLFKQMRASGPKPTPLLGDPFPQGIGLVRLTDE